MPLSSSLAAYARYREQVGAPTYIDITRRTDPARVPQVWENLRQLVSVHGAPGVVQLWSKDPAGVLRQGDALLRELAAAGTLLTAQVTITGLAGTPWEPRVPPEALQALPDLAACLGGMAHLTWRYDPIIPTVHRVERYAALAQAVAALGVRRAVINFIAPPGRYARVDRRVSALLPAWAAGMPGYDDAWREATARELLAIAQGEGLRLACCAESAGLAARLPGLSPAACGDAAWFAELGGVAPPRGGSRTGCGCARYFDVGSYGHWRACHGCLYCYAG
jgi:hypothetical protein